MFASTGQSKYHRTLFGLTVTLIPYCASFLGDTTLADIIFTSSADKPVEIRPAGSATSVNCLV